MRQCLFNVCKALGFIRYHKKGKRNFLSSRFRIGLSAATDQALA